MVASTLSPQELTSSSTSSISSTPKQEEEEEEEEEEGIHDDDNNNSNIHTSARVELNDLECPPLHLPTPSSPSNPINPINHSNNNTNINTNTNTSSISNGNRSTNKDELEQDSLPLISSALSGSASSAHRSPSKRIQHVPNPSNTTSSTNGRTTNITTASSISSSPSSTSSPNKNRFNNNTSKSSNKFPLPTIPSLNSMESSSIDHVNHSTSLNDLHALDSNNNTMNGLDTLHDDSIDIDSSTSSSDGNHYNNGNNEEDGTMHMIHPNADTDNNSSNKSNINSSPDKSNDNTNPTTIHPKSSKSIQPKKKRRYIRKDSKKNGTIQKSIAIIEPDAYHSVYGSHVFEHHSILPTTTSSNNISIDQKEGHDKNAKSSSTTTPLSSTSTVPPKVYLAKNQFECILQRKAICKKGTLSKSTLSSNNTTSISSKRRSLFGTATDTYHPSNILNNNKSNNTNSTSMNNKDTTIETEQEEIEGDVSLGMTLNINSGMVIVQALVPLSDGRASPAQRTGVISPGDVLISIDGKSLVGLPSLEKLIERLKPLSTCDVNGFYPRILRLRFLIGDGLDYLKEVNKNVGSGNGGTGSNSGNNSAAIPLSQQQQQQPQDNSQQSSQALVTPVTESKRPMDGADDLFGLSMFANLTPVDHMSGMPLFPTETSPIPIATAVSSTLEVTTATTTDISNQDGGDTNDPTSTSTKESNTKDGTTKKDKSSDKLTTKSSPNKTMKTSTSSTSLPNNLSENDIISLLISHEYQTHETKLTSQFYSLNDGLSILLRDEQPPPSSIPTASKLNQGDENQPSQINQLSSQELVEYKQKTLLGAKNLYKEMERNWNLASRIDPLYMVRNECKSFSSRSLSRFSLVGSTTRRNSSSLLLSSSSLHLPPPHHSTMSPTSQQQHRINESNCESFDSQDNMSDYESMASTAYLDMNAGYGDEMLLKLAATNRPWRKQMVDALVNACVHESSSSATSGMTTPTNIHSTSTDKEEKTMENMNNTTSNHSNNNNISNLLPSLFLFGEKNSDIMNLKRSSAALPPGEMTAVLYDLSLSISSSVPFDINVDDRNSIVAATAGSGNTTPNRSFSTSHNSINNNNTTPTSNNNTTINTSMNNSIHQNGFIRQLSTNTTTTTSYADKATKERAEACKFLLHDMIPPWLNTFRPVKIQQRHVLWSKEGGLSGYGGGGDGAMSNNSSIMSSVVARGGISGSGGAGGAEDDTTIYSVGSTNTRDTARWSTNSLESRKKLEEKIIGMELDPDTFLETCELVTFYFTRKVLSEISVARESNNQNDDSTTPTTNDDSKALTFISKYGSYLKLHTSLVSASEIGAESVIRSLLDMAKYETQHLDGMKKLSKANGLILYDPKILSCILVRLPVIVKERRHQQLLAGAYPDLKPWQVRAASPEMDLQLTNLYKGVDSGSGNDEVIGDLNIDAILYYYDYLSLIMDFSIAARNDERLVREWCILSTSRHLSGREEEKRKENFRKVVNIEDSGIQSSFTRDLPLLLDLSMQDMNHSTALKIMTDIMECSSGIALDTSLMTNIVSYLREISRHAMGKTFQEKSSSCIDSISICQVVLVLRQMKLILTKHGQDLIDVSTELLHLLELPSQMNKNQSDVVQDKSNTLSEQEKEILSIITANASPDDTFEALSRWPKSESSKLDLTTALRRCIMKGAEDEGSQKISGTFLRIQKIRNGGTSVPNRDAELSSSFFVSPLYSTEMPAVSRPLIWQKLADGTAIIDK